MYPKLLALHSLWRWLVLISLLLAIYRAYKGWLSNTAFSKADNKIRKWATIIIQIQLVIGLALYFVSPVVHYFLHHFREAVRQREIRFFGMEHIVMMIIAVAIVTIGSATAKRKPVDHEKYKTIAIWFTIALLIILSSIPWPFAPPPFTSRPYIRPFW